MKDIRLHDPHSVLEPFRSIYTHGVEVVLNSRSLFISGQVGVTPDGVVMPDFESQCRQAIENMIGVLQSANMEITDLVKLGFFLTRPEDMETLVKLRREMLPNVRPAITTVFVAGLVSPDWFVEVEATAAA